MSFLSRIMVAKSQAHFSSGVYSRFGGSSGSVSIQGSRKKRSGQAKSRVGLLAFAFVCVYCVIGGRLLEYSVRDPDLVFRILPPPRPLAFRPPISHPHGDRAAMGIPTPSAFFAPDNSF